MKRAWFGCAAAMAALGFMACQGSATHPREPAGTDTGNPFDGNEGVNTGGENGACDIDSSSIQLDEQTPLGFVPQTVLDLVVGQHSQSLAWLPSDVTYGPESGRSDITLDIEALGNARLLDREPRQASGEGPAINLADLGSPCQDSVEVDVSIAITTAGGALSERVETTIEASAADFARASIVLDVTDIVGSFEADPQPQPNMELTRSSLSLTLGFSEYGAVGSVQLYSEFRSLDGSAVGQGGAGELAHFPADDYCGASSFSITAEQSVRGLSMAGVLDRLNANSPAPLRYTPSAPSSELSFSFENSEERVCARFDGGQSVYNLAAEDAALEFPGTVTLASADGRIEGDFPVRIVAQSSSGTLQMVYADASAQADDTTQAAALPAQFGIGDSIDFTAYDGGRVEFTNHDESQSAGGQLTVYGLDVADCVTNPPPPDPGGMSSPGCRGTDRIPLWTANWGEVQ